MSTFLSKSLAAAFGLALVGGTAYAQAKQDPKPMDPNQTVNEEQEKGMDKGKDTARSRDDASPAKAPAQAAPSDITNKDKVKKQKMAKEGKDYDAANKAAAKSSPPPAAAPKKALQKQQQHDSEVSKGKDASEHDSTPVQK
jgi:hypothetical protein